LVETVYLPGETQPAYKRVRLRHNDGTFHNSQTINYAVLLTDVINRPRPSQLVNWPSQCRS